jgi:alpha-L-rhamnosidase
MSGITVSRRGFVGTLGTGVLAAQRTGAAGSTAPLRVASLQIDGLDQPNCLHSQAARFSWKLLASRRDVRQQAYRIGVASTRDKAEAGLCDLWDSGRVVSDRSFDIAYAGPPLTSRACCFWRVRVWDDRGEQAVSDVASWEMGLLSASDWRGDWMAAETASLRADRLAGLPWMTGRTINAPGMGRSFRLEFDLPEDADLLIYAAGDRAPTVALDGSMLPLPAQRPMAMTHAPTGRCTVRARRGRHVLAMFIPGDSHRAAADNGPRAAVLIRAQTASGKVAHFDGRLLSTAIGKPDDWAARRTMAGAWSPAAPAGDEAAFPGNGAFLLRRRFTVAKRPRSARLYITALGAYVPFINGTELGDGVLTPEWTDFRRHVLYRAYDVTGLLRPGDNLLGALVGDGWYGSGMSTAGRFGFGGPPLRLRAQLEIEYEDGRSETVATDDGWLVAPSMITSSDIYDGEDVDARLEQPGWATADFKPDARWETAQRVETAEIAMVGAAVQPITRSLTLQPKTLTTIEPGTVVVDFGQNFAGWITLRAKGKPGQQIVMRFAELLRPDGRVDQTNLRSARAADTWILRGEEDGELFEPRFTYHGFRYVQIEGLTSALSAADVHGIVIHSSLPETGQLRLGQYVPQRLWQNSLWSQRSHFVGIPTDCPQRDERLGWMGDAHVFWDAACFNMDADAFTRKFMRDVRDAQRSDGSFPDIAPNNDLDHFTGPGASPGWADAGVFLPWTSWQRFGDTAVIDENWSAMVRFLASIRAANADLIWSNRRGNDFGDWLALDAKNPGDPTTPKDLVATAMWKGAADAMADMATASGRTAEAGAYRRLAQAIAAAFVAKFAAVDGGIGNGSQTGFILALHFDILPAALRKPAADRLVADIVRRGKLLSSGFLGTPHSLDVLAKAGHQELVYDLLLRTEFPSWGYMIAHNATTIWERWNGDVGDVEMNSFNHYALGAVSGFMFRRIAGIDPVEPGFRRFRFDPVYDRRMPTGGGRFESRSGLIATRWEQRANGDFSLDISVPANTRCSLHLPARSSAQVTEGGRPLSGRHGGPEASNGRRVVLDLGSGDYAFAVRAADYASQ